jgi:hypothetical protein
LCACHVHDLFCCATPTAETHLCCAAPATYAHFALN